MKKNDLFFIAILPNDNIQEEVTLFKNYAAENFHTKKAFNSPPHITLIPPFRWSKFNFLILENALFDFSNNRNTFHQTICDFDAFVPKVIFVDVVENEDLKTLQKELESFLKEKIGLEYDRPERKFHPHMTIAFKDLKKEMFEKAMSYFSNIKYQRVFEVNEISLLKHDGKKWKVFRKFEF